MMTYFDSNLKLCKLNNKPFRVFYLKYFYSKLKPKVEMQELCQLYK